MRKRGKSWQVDLTLPDGKRLRRQFTNPGAAELWEAKARAAMLAGEPIPEGAQAGGGYTLLQALRDVASLPAVRGGWSGAKAEETLVLMGRMAVRFYGEAARVADITTPEVDRYVSALHTTGKAGATINRRLAALGKLLRFAHSRGHLDRLPNLRREKESEGRLRFVTREEENKIVSILLLWGQHDIADLVTFLIDTGCRLGEALKLDWQSIQADRVTFWITKGDKPRTVPLTQRVSKLLTNRSVAGPATTSAGPFTDLRRDQIRRVWDRLRGHLGLHDVVLHTLRHTCASRLVQGGVDLRRVQTWMGHKSIQVTMRYSHLSPKDLDECVSVLEAA